jgi:hypothetical protein
MDIERWARECAEWHEIREELIAKRGDVTAWQVSLEQRKRMLARGDRPMFPPPKAPSDGE